MELPLTEVGKIAGGTSLGVAGGHQELSLGHTYNQVLDAYQTSKWRCQVGS